MHGIVRPPPLNIAQARTVGRQLFGDFALAASESERKGSLKMLDLRFTRLDVYDRMQGVVVEWRVRLEPDDQEHGGIKVDAGKRWEGVAGL
jgi:hypothetical protein